MLYSFSSAPRLSTTRCKAVTRGSTFVTFDLLPVLHICSLVTLPPSGNDQLFCR